MNDAFDNPGIEAGREKAKRAKEINDALTEGRKQGRLEGLREAYELAESYVHSYAAQEEIQSRIAELEKEQAK